MKSRQLVGIGLIILASLPQTFHIAHLGTCAAPPLQIVTVSVRRTTLVFPDLASAVGSPK